MGALLEGGQALPVPHVAPPLQLYMSVKIDMC
jgi:hypothetical protein